MSHIFQIHSPSTGSSKLQIFRDTYGRIKIIATTDFVEAHCVFSDIAAGQIRDAIDELLK